MSKKKILTYIGGPLLSLGILTATAFAINSITEGYRVPAGAVKVKVTSSSGCQAVTNSGISDIFVPTNTTSEWNSFLTNKPSYVTTGACANLPTAPQNLTGVIGSQQVTLNWSAPADNGGEAVKYDIYRSVSSNNSYSKILLGTTNTTYTNSGLTDGVVYYYKVSASNSAGEGPQSNEFKTSQYMAVKINCTNGTITSYVGPYSSKDLAVRATISNLESCLKNNGYITPVVITNSSYSTCSYGHCTKHTYQSGGFGLTNSSCTTSTGPKSYQIIYPTKTWTYINSNQIAQSGSGTFSGTAKEFSYGDLSIYDNAGSYMQGDGCAGGIYPEQVTFHTTVCNGQTSVSYCNNSDVLINTSFLK